MIWRLEMYDYGVTLASPDTVGFFFWVIVFFAVFLLVFGVFFGRGASFHALVSPFTWGVDEAFVTIFSQQRSPTYPEAVSFFVHDVMAFLSPIFSLQTPTLASVLHLIRNVSTTHFLVFPRMHMPRESATIFFARAISVADRDVTS